MPLPLGRQQIALQHKAPHKGRSWGCDQLLGAGALVQMARFEHRHPIADGQGFLGVVGHDHAAGPAASQHPRELCAQAQPHLHVEVGEGFIEQHERTAGGQGTGQGQALTLAARELMGIAALEALQTEQLQQPAGAAAVLTAAQTETGIAPGIEVGEQGVVLKHHAHTAPLRRQPAMRAGHLLPADTHHAAIWFLKAGDQSEQGGFAAARGAQQTHQFAWAQLKVDIAQGPIAARGRAAVAMPQTIELHLGPQGQLRVGQLDSHQALWP